MFISFINTHLRLYTMYIDNGRISPIPNGVSKLPTMAVYPSESSSNESSEEDENKLDSPTSAIHDSNSTSNQRSEEDKAEINSSTIASHDSDSSSYESSDEDEDEIDSSSGGRYPRRVSISLHNIITNHYSEEWSNGV